MLFFDERFNYIGEGSAYQRVQSADNSNASLTLMNIKAPKNGYAYVYVSNESDEAVYFDNLQVAHNRGRIVEENHYYSYGLQIAAISSKKVGNPAEGHLGNQNLYNDKELIEEADLAWYDYGFRSYDPQIGRFAQLDPLTDDYPFLTPYQYASCDPISNIDIDGLEGASALGGVVTAASNMAPVVVKNAGKVVIKGASVAQKTIALSNIALKTLDMGSEFVPFLSGGKDVYKGIRDGDGWQVVGGLGSMALDFFTAGTGTLIKGTVKVIVKTGVKSVVRTETKTIVKKEARQNAGEAVKKFGCFVAGTLIWTTDSSLVKIEEIKIGDIVYAYDDIGKKVVQRKVTDAYVRKIEQLVKVEFDDGLLLTTIEHPFYVKGVWVKAEKLKTGDYLFLGNGKEVAVNKITVIDTAVTVYNFTVDIEHNYFVGQARVLVHNTCGQELAKAEGKIDTYNNLKKTIKGLSDLEVHHLIEKRFKNLFGEKSGEMISKVLNKVEHRKFTNAWRKAIEYGVGTNNATKEVVQKMAKEIYKDYPDILKALEPYLK